MRAEKDSDISEKVKDVGLKLKGMLESWESS